MSLPDKAPSTAGLGESHQPLPLKTTGPGGGGLHCTSPCGRAAQPLQPWQMIGVLPLSHEVRAHTPAISARTQLKQSRAARPAPRPSKHPGRVTCPPSQPPERGTLSPGWSEFPARIPPGETHLHPPEPCPENLLPPLPLPWQPEPRRANRKRGPRSSHRRGDREGKSVQGRPKPACWPPRSRAWHLATGSR